MRILLIIGGALLGLALGVSSRGLFGAAVGAFVGLVLAELAAARHRIGEPAREMRALRRRAPAPAAEASPITGTRGAIEGAPGGTSALLVMVACVASAFACAVRAETPTHDPLTPDDFAYGVKVVVPAEAAAYRVSLPLGVYQKLVRSDLGDLRVFNERGEVAPHTLERPRSETSVSGTPTVLPLFTLRGDEQRALDLVRITIESGSARAGVGAPVGGSVHVPAGGAAAPVGSAGTGEIRSYVVDGRALDAPLAAFELSWPADAPEFAGRLRVEGSNTLGTWYVVVSEAPIANLHAGTARLVERRVDLQGARSKYWRLSWVGEAAPFPITSIVAEPARARVEVQRAKLVVEGAPVAEHAGAFDFDLGAQLPVDRVNLELPEPGSIVEMELFSRATPAEAWQRVTRGGFYRLKNPAAGEAGATHGAAADLTNGAISIEPDRHRYWRARTDVRGGGLGRGVPKLQVGWLPHDVVFVARGSGPFTIAYGSAVAVPATVPLNAIPPDAVIFRASLEAPQVLGGEARRVLPEQGGWFTSKAAVLWIVLGVGVVVLAYMAWKRTLDAPRAP